MARETKNIKVLIADDHRSFAEALRTVIDLERGLIVSEVVGDGAEAVAVVERDHPDVVLLDIEMPGIDGIAATRAIKLASPDTQVVILTAHEDDTLIARAVEAGASGFLSKLRPVADVAGAVRAVTRGESLLQPEEITKALQMLDARRRDDARARSRVERLTPRQIEILQLMADGLDPEKIADHLSISRHTLRTHVQNILTRLRVHSKLQALAEAIRYGKVVAHDRGD